MSANSGADKPKQHPDKVKPNPNLHPAAASIVAAVAVDVHLTEDAEQGSPEDEEYRVPKEELEGLNKRQQIDGGRQEREPSHDLGVDPAGIGMIAVLAVCLEVAAV